MSIKVQSWDFRKAAIPASHFLHGQILARGFKKEYWSPVCEHVGLHHHHHGEPINGIFCVEHLCFGHGMGPTLGERQCNSTPQHVQFIRKLQSSFQCTFLVFLRV